MTDHANDLSLHVKHGSAGIALIDGRVRLKELRSCESRAHLSGINPVADMSGGKSICQPVWGADDNDLLANLRIVRITQDCRA